MKKQTASSTKNTSHFDDGIDLNDFLYDPEIIATIKRHKLKLKNPTSYSQFFSLRADKTEYQYGSMFEPHTDKPNNKEVRHVFQFCFWHKNFVFFHVVYGKVVVVKPTLEPIIFDFSKLHGFIPKAHVDRAKITVKISKLKPRSRISKITKETRVSKERIWWLDRVAFYQHRLLFIGKFL